MNGTSKTYKLCRTCAILFEQSNLEVARNLFAVKNEGLVDELLPIWREINAWQLKIDANDGLPQTICDNCYKKFISIAEFREQCENAQTQLLSIFSGENESKVPSVDTRANNEADVNDAAETVLADASIGEESSMQNNSIEDSCEPNETGEDFENASETTVFSKSSEESEGYSGRKLEPIIENGQPIIENGSEISNNLYVCQYCYSPPDGLAFDTYEELSNHLFEEHDPNLLYKCPYCSYQFRFASIRNLHIQRNHATIPDTRKRIVRKRSTTCSFCRRKVEGYLAAHETICRHIGDWECGICSKKFNRTPLYKFRLHKSTHDWKNAVTCKFCDRIFAGPLDFQNHWSSLHRNQSKPWENACSACGILFSSEADKRNHEMKIHKITSTLSCPHCKRTYTSKYYLKKHITDFHPNKAPSGAPLCCDDCGAKFNSIYKLRYHKQRPRDENGCCLDNSASGTKMAVPRKRYIYSCVHCSKRFATKYNLGLHLKTHDERLKPFPCSKCHVRFDTDQQLQEHVSKLHDNTAIYDCNKCEKRFCYKKDLLVHQIYHSEVKIPCSTDGCDFIARTEKALAGHMRNKHRQFLCEYCGASFTKFQLKNHLRTAHSAQVDMEVGAEELHPQVECQQEIFGYQDKVSVQYVDDVPLPASGLTPNSSDSFDSDPRSPMENNSPSIMPDLLDEDILISSSHDPDNEIIIT